MENNSVCKRVRKHKISETKVNEKFKTRIVQDNIHPSFAFHQWKTKKIPWDNLSLRKSTKYI